MAELAYMLQTWSETGNPPEMVFEQGKANEEEYRINLGSRIVSDFLLEPATVVFLDDVANEYGVEDMSFYSAMVATIIYRELDGTGGREVASLPLLQRIYEGLEAVFNLPSYGALQLNEVLGTNFPTFPILDGDPSAGIGGLSSKAIKRIERDAKQLGMPLYIPDIGFDIPRRLNDYAYERGEQTARLREPFTDPFVPDYYIATILPPSKNTGVWRSVMPENADRGLRGLRERHEPTLGYISAEVAIAMQTPEYQEVQSDEQRIAYIIGYHANRSRVPGKDIYDLSNLADDSRKQTRTEIGWAKSFEELIDEVRTEIQSDAQNE
ncbi:MAG: hypothetical protein OXG78_16525 [Chloroflexi bacterium]|nr:hypothetical protein [Chloroflexota bacterium]